MVVDGVFPFWVFNATHMLLSVYIKLGFIGSGEISIANSVPSDRSIVVVLTMC